LLNLPTHLQTDYYKQYVETYKNDKAKNLLRQVLVGMDKLQPTLSLRQTLQKLLDKFKFVKELNSVDRTPIELKVRYLLTAHKGDL
jgi:thiaminase